MKYKYLIYKIYSWRDDTPIINTVLTLAATHLFQFYVLLLLIDQLVVPIPLLGSFKKQYVYIAVTIYFVLFYFLIYNKQRWQSYIEEYKNETEQQRKRGNIIVISYLVSSVLLFFISLPVLFSIGRHLHK